MNKLNELLDIIEKHIDEINKSIANISIKNINDINKIKDIIEQNSSLNQFNFLNEIELEKLKEILPLSFEKDIVNLSFYINILNTSYAAHISEKPEVLAQIKSILSRIHLYLVELIQKQTQIQVKLSSYNKTKAILQKIIVKIKNDEDTFLDEELECIYSILNTLDDKNKAMELMIAFGEKILINMGNTILEIEEEEILENDSPNNILEELISIFTKYGLNFNDFYDKLSSKEQKDFISYVNPHKVESIIDTLREFDIYLNDSYFNSPILLARAKQIKDLLLYSNSELLKETLIFLQSKEIVNSNVVDINGKVKTCVDFDLMLDAPARFIDRKKRYKMKGNQKIDISLGSDILGANKDFKENILLFESYGVRPIDFCQNAAVSILPNEKIKKIISVFELYGIGKEYFTKTLSCFNSIHQADSLDQFIELGQFNYILKNMSRCRLLADDLIFYRLIYGFKYTVLPIESLITKKGIFSSLITETSKNSEMSFGINNYNRQSKVNQTSVFYGNSALYQTYDELINPLSSDVTIALSRADSMIHWLDENFLVKNDEGIMIYPNVYHFGEIDIKRGKWNINISRNKVLRICNELMQHNIEITDMDTIMYIVTKNSILTQEEYNIIYNQINYVRKKGVEKSC